MSLAIDLIEYKNDVPLSTCTTFRIGGIAKRIIYPSSIEELKIAVDYCKQNSIRYMILGNGSNVLFSDEGFNGIIIQIFNKMNSISIEGNTVYAQAGATLGKIALLAKENSLTGFEFAAGIPGTLGGAVVMNAGAYGGEMKDVVEYVDILGADGEVKRYNNSEMEFSYRYSIVDESMTVVGAAIKLQKGDISAIEDKMNELKIARITKQPLELPSAGSTFKRPVGYFAAKLIEDAGLKGYKCGGAMVSDKHAGFVVNYASATSKDVLDLIEYVKNTVFEKFGVLLEPEVKIIK